MGVGRIGVKMGRRHREWRLKCGVEGGGGGRRRQGQLCERVFGAGLPLQVTPDQMAL